MPREAWVDRSPGLFFVVFPQALRYIVPALVAQLVIVVRDTTFGYVVTYGELMQNAKVLIANYHSLVPVYLVWRRFTAL
jgi:glutamate transport system permease protein